MSREDLEQHFMLNTEPHRRLFSKGILKSRKVVEFGVGTGALTNLVLDAGASAVLGYEIQEGLCEIRNTRFTLRIADFTKVDLGYLASTPDICVVSNPPYKTLDFIKDNVLSVVEDVVIMVPLRMADSNGPFAGFRIVDVLSGSDFQPSSRGTHVILVRGFGYTVPRQ